ncbi:hypothetical protein EJV47_26095 [Hymenobacter gummosus]|uniref:DUF4297 domain-containing protein n=1 Tax=Hymenobacter gummosus TaxID=1776032 RepID=A0A3S0H202_9BACT|nr:hypothetical protein [Hymenobacter gummosus]RTQ45045.1 hypothetical protein EJV47_26095 [Hymenobacter gummosus]
MSISKLFLFAKNTDASASMRGYQYQVFKTVETWLENYLNQVDEAIYCDYEEDIFQHNELTQAATFRQLKLYSTPFSFRSEEIQKAVAHFFMLHVKTDYAAKDKEFVFEANSRVAEHREGNEADLLRTWVANQDTLPDALLSQCALKVKSLVTEYVDERTSQLAEQLADKLKKKAEDAPALLALQADSQALQEAVAVFQQLTDQDWEDFTRRIKWRFDGVSPDSAFKGTIARLEELVAMLPDMPKERRKGFLGMLCMRVDIKASEQAPEDRKLVNGELTNLLLQAGTLEDLWYHEVFTKWNDLGQPEDVRLGEFYEVLQAVSYCRNAKNLQAHDAFWIGLLNWYVANLAQQPAERKQALYELIWLRMRPTEYLEPAAGDLFGCEEYVREYFSDFSSFTVAAEFEDIQSLLFLVTASSLNGKSALTPAETAGWLRQFKQQLDLLISQPRNPSDLCRLLECSANLYFFAGSQDRSEENVAKIMAPLEQLLAVLDQAPLYNATQLSSRIHTHIRLLIKLDEEGNETLIDAFKDYAGRLDAVVEKKKGAHERARRLVASGATYLESKNPSSLLKALRDFHEAKALWLQEETFEGYTLALLNIAQVYSALDMHFAAKYYGLWAAWVSWQKGSRKLAKRIAQGYGMAFHADFVQGAWLSALLDFEYYFRTREQFDTQPIDAEEADMPRKIIMNYGFLLYAAPLLAPGLQQMAQEKLTAAGYLKDDYLDDVLAMLQVELPEPKLLAGLTRNFADAPLNDMGPERTVRFHALGIEWHVRFPNTYGSTALGEDFCAMLQVLLAEIALAKTDFHLPGTVVDFTLEQTAAPREPEQLPDNSKAKWKVFVQPVDSADYEEVKMGAAFVSTTLKAVLQDLSLLPTAEFEQAFLGLFTESNLGAKSLQATSYQRMYRSLFSEERFNDYRRDIFSPLPTRADFPLPNPMMHAKEGLSKKYNQASALQSIANRFEKATHNIHQTLAHLKQEAGYSAWLQGLRAEGWPDWQIVVAMMNFMGSYKANRMLEGKSFASEAEHQAALQNEFKQLLQRDEVEKQAFFPLEAFQSRDFRVSLEQMPLISLNSFRLQSNARFPNPSAVRQFMNERFNVQLDVNDTNNPLL